MTCTFAKNKKERINFAPNQVNQFINIFIFSMMPMCSSYKKTNSTKWNYTSENSFFLVYTDKQMSLAHRRNRVSTYQHMMETSSHLH